MGAFFGGLILFVLGSCIMALAATGTAYVTVYGWREIKKMQAQIKEYKN
jgi:hypothetical protein